MIKEYDNLTKIFNIQDNNEFLILKRSYLESIDFYNKNGKKLSKSRKNEIIDFLDEASPNLNFPLYTPCHTIIAFKPIASLNDFISTCNRKIIVDFVVSENTDIKLKLPLDKKNFCFLFKIKNEILLENCIEIAQHNATRDSEVIISIIENPKIETNFELAVLYSY